MNTSALNVMGGTFRISLVVALIAGLYVVYDDWQREWNIHQMIAGVLK